MTNMAPEQGKTGAGITVRDVVAVLFRRKWIILGVFAVTTGVTAAFTLSQPVYWESTGKVLLRRGMQDNIMQSYRRTLSWEEELSSEVETARSPAIMDRARRLLASRAELHGTPERTIQPTQAEATVVGESNVIAISYRDLDPEVAREVTNALLQAFTDFREETYQMAFPESFFAAEIEQAKSELEGLQRERQAFLTQANIVDVATERTNLLTSRAHATAVANGIRQELTEKESQLAQMHAYLQNPEAYPDVPFISDNMIGNERVISDLKSELVRKRLRQEELSKIYKPGVPDLVRLESEIEGTRRLLASEVRDRIRLAQMEVNTLRAKHDEAESDLHARDQRIEEMPYQETRLADYDRRISALSAKYDDLVRDQSRAKVTQATQTQQTAFLLAPASEPYPKNTKDYVRIALAPIFSLIVGLGLAFFVDGLDTTIKNPRDAEGAFEVPVLATLNEQKEKKA